MAWMESSEPILLPQKNNATFMLHSFVALEVPSVQVPKLSYIFTMSEEADPPLSKNALKKKLKAEAEEKGGKGCCPLRRRNGQAGQG